MITSLRYILLILIPLVIAAVLYLLGPVGQPQSYHLFADDRVLWGIPRLADVASNSIYLLFGGAGLAYCIEARPSGALYAWTAFFFGVTAAGLGSAWYHWSPNDATLVWDRLPMTIAFTGAFVALYSEFVAPRVGPFLLVPALLVGLGTVVYWRGTGDLRFYLALQVLVLACSFVILLAFECRYGQKRFLILALACYLLGVLFEQLDHQVFDWTGALVSGHTLKHLLTGLAPLCVYIALRTRPSREAEQG